MHKMMIGLSLALILLAGGCQKPGSNADVPFMSFNVTEAYMPSDDDTAPYPDFSLILTDTATEDITFDLAFSDTDLFVSYPSSVTIPAGSRSRTISMISKVVTGETTVTASYGSHIAEAAIIVFDGSTPREVTSLTPVSQTVTAGMSAIVTVAIAPPAPAGGQVVNITASSNLSPASSTVTIPPGDLEATFSIPVDEVSAQGETLEFSIAASSASAEIDIYLPPNPGLVICEVYYDHSDASTDEDNGYEWVKLYNGTSSPIDLSGYSLGYGGSDYTYGNAALSGIIHAWSCFLLGGGAAEAPNMDQVYNYDPDIQNSGPTADGVALFESGNSTPVSAVIYGGSNDNSLEDENGLIPAPHVGDALSGQSIALTESGWVIRPIPTPELSPPY